MILRNCAENILTSLKDTPVVYLAGARQTGKSTLAKHFVDAGVLGGYVTLDDQSILLAATKDPQGFVRGLGDRNVVLDEVQRVPELFLAVKHAVDEDRRPGRFLLTGSAHALQVPRVSESLAGRMEIHTLWPFSQGELRGNRETFIERVFSESFDFQDRKTDCAGVFSAVVKGGYPEPCGRPEQERRDAWFKSYLSTLVQRDVRDLARVERLVSLPDLLGLLSARCAGLLNFSDLSRSLQIPQTTLKRYLALLEAVCLIVRLRPYSRTPSGRITKAPKILLNDTGLVCSLMGIHERQLESSHPLSGPVLENFVGAELLKQSSWAPGRPALYHFRVHAHQAAEVDLVLADTSGRCVGIEVKSAGSVSSGDIRGLRILRESLGNRFIRGIVLYLGDKVVPFEKNIHAVPLPVLWD